MNRRSHFDTLNFGLLRQSVRAAQAEVHIGFEKAAFVAAVKPLAAQWHAHELAAV